MVLEGTLFNGDERWAMSLMLRDQTAGDDDPPADTAGPMLVSWFTSGAARISNLARLWTVKWNRIDSAGRYVRKDRTVLFELGQGNTAPAGAVASVQPPQLAIAHSLLTNATRGRAHRGRVYPPMQITGVDNSGRISAGICSELANSMGGLIRDLNRNLGGWQVVVASGIDGTIRPVTKVEVGNVVDTQRRRRGHLPETYWSSTVDLDPGAATPV